MNPIDLQAIRDIADTIRAMLGEDYDDATFLDTLDGETDAMDMIGALIQGKVEAEASASAMKEVAAAYSARAARFAAKADACKVGMGKLLDAMGTAKVAHPLATVSRTKPRERLEITDESAVPSQLCRIIREPDRDAIKAALAAGEEIPGAALVAGAPGLTVRIR